jgi:hypothetical protein
MFRGRPGLGAFVAAIALTITLSTVASTTAGAGSGPLSPWKYHTTGQVIHHEQPSPAVEVFLLAFDEFAPDGRQNRVEGYVGNAQYAGFASLYSYDKTTGQTVYHLDADLDPSGLKPALPMLANMTFDYNRTLGTHTVSMSGTINGVPFTVPPMQIVLY